LAYTHVDKPIRIGAIELKNRIVRPAHGTVLGKGTMNDVLDTELIRTARESLNKQSKIPTADSS
jgi:2,4-dienoyl-CoA reductase-like NADH-dependent reductase (Old Yellow Enzyme family)